MAKVMLDPGHGGKDPGAVGNGLKEKDITLSLSLKTGAILKRHGVDVEYTRTTDTFVDLTPRTTKANQAKVDIFVSQHVNSATNAAATGLEIFTSRGQTKSDELATYIGIQLKTDFPQITFRTDYSDGDIDKESNFTVLAKTSMAATLIEYMFIVNPKDAQILRTKLDDFALSTAKGILKYLKIPYKEDNTQTIKLTICGQIRHIQGVNKNNTNYVFLDGKEVPIRQVLESLGFTNISGYNNEVVVK